MKSLVVVCIAAALFAMPKANAQDASTQPATAAESPEADISEIMVLQQMRHIKLWFAGHAGNWPLADYEVDKLKEGFADVDKLIGGDTVGQQVGARIGALEKAIEAKDRNAFTRGFDRLSAGCNSCHHLLDHAFIVIQRPTLLPYGDQFFAPRN
jgi:hypothetical protein